MNKEIIKICKERDCSISEAKNIVKKINEKKKGHKKMVEKYKQAMKNLYEN